MIGRTMLCTVWLLAVVRIVFAADPPASAAAHVSKPFEYAGYSAPEYQSFKTSSEYVMMSDGVKLALDVHLPADGPDRSAFPVILEYTPYQRSTIDPETGRVHDAAGTTSGKFFLSYGYALVVADMRGTGASTGWLMDFMPRLGKDGAQLVEWIARQPWCDGNIGMEGSSYLGWSQTVTASRAPRALKCITPECIPLDGFTGEPYPGGIYLEGFFKRFSPYMKLILQNYNLPDQGIRPTKPVVDEDKDGELKDEIPVDVNHNGTFLDDPFPPTYSDGQKRAHLYYAATLAHQKGDYDYAEWASVRHFIDAPTPLGFTMYDLSPSAHVPGIMRSAIPIYHFGGWFDAFTRGTFELYCTMAKTNPSKLIMAPSYHDFDSGPFWKHFGFVPEQVAKMHRIEHLRFFDRYLKGIYNGIGKEPPIYLYVMNGGGWRFENEWPLARQVVTKFFFDLNNALVMSRTEDGVDTYTADLTHDGSYGDNKGNRYLGIVGECPDAPPIRTEKDKQCLTYTTKPVIADTEVTGHPIGHLWVSSTAEDGDFFVYLEDVDEDGQAMLVTEGQLRAGFASLRDNSEMIRAGKFKVNVLPKLPWHGFEKNEYDDKVFAKDAVVELVIDLNPTAWVFKKGHRVRVSIACADYPTFKLHPKLSLQDSPGASDNIVPTVTVHRNATHPSHIELPIIPAPPGS
jgi:predicted acyl esterase